MRSALVLALCAALVRADEDPEVLFLRAYWAMGEPAEAAAAEKTLRTLLDGEGTPPELKARCLLALAQGARAKGDVAAEHRLLEQLIAEHPKADAAARARRLLGPDQVLDEIRLVPRGWYLDLDDGTVSETRTPVHGKDAEMRGGEFLAKARDDAEFAGKVAPVSVKPWKHVLTSEGRMSWVQVLRAVEDGKSIAVRIVTRRSGLGDVLPAPKDPFCIGGGEGIEVHFGTSDRFARYRIERSTGGAGAEAFETTSSPFLDRTATHGVRYLYRIVGETADGRQGFAATLEGTHNSRGVVTGVAELDRADGRSFDFLLGKVVEKGDITFTGYSGDSASFADAFGRRILPLAPMLDPAGSVWDSETQDTFDIASGSSFLVPLRGGGIARCRLEIPEQRRGPAPPVGGPVRDPEAILHYEACGDSAALPRPARLEVNRDEKGAAIAVSVDPPYRVAQIDVTDLAADRALPALDVKDGVARDPTAGPEEVREYRAVGIDRHGRKSAATTAVLLPERPRAGEFAFHYQQGYSLEAGRIVPPDEADVLFVTCAGGISSITLRAPGGIVNLADTLPREMDQGTAEAIFDVLLRASPQVRLKPQASADSRTPASDVFVLRTRHGGWAKIAITHRGSEGGWTKYLATVKYVLNFREPVFGQGAGEELGAFSFGDLQSLRARADILDQWQKGWQQIARAPQRKRSFDDEAREEGEMPDPAKTQEVLFSRQRHQDYEKATFSFAFGIRDDPGLAQTRNDWSFEYGNGGDSFWVRTVTDDRSTITDLGKCDWKGLARKKRLTERDLERTPARYGSMYMIHTIDTDENFFSFLRVTAIRPGDLVAFEWVSLRGEELARSPGLALDAGTEKAIKALLAGLPKTPDERGPDPAAAIRKKLAAPEIRIGVAAEDAATLLGQLGEITGVRFAVKAKDVQPVSVFGTRLTPEAILDAVCEETGLHWRVEEDGSVSLGNDE